TINYSYGQNFIHSSMAFGANSIDENYIITDAFGRTILNQHAKDRTASTFDTVYTTYDYRGRVNQVSRPCAVAFNTTCSLTNAVTYTHDVLNRVTSVVNGLGATTTNVYSGRDITMTLTASGET